jgi:nucleoside-diphosphate-sugar epimerase
MAQRNWRCDISETRSVLGYEPQWTLEKGVSEMLEKFKVKG